METTVKHLLETKGAKIWSVDPDTSVYDAIKLMAEKGIGLVLVMKDGKTAGVLSERDYARKIILEGRSSRETPVRDIMTRQVIFGRPDLRVGEGLSLMTQRHFRHLPILEDGTIIGVLSIGDLVKAIIADQRFRIEMLEGYISS